jgi:hypothetical protein
VDVLEGKKYGWLVKVSIEGRYHEEEIAYYFLVL